MVTYNWACVYTHRRVCIIQTQWSLWCLTLVYIFVLWTSKLSFHCNAQHEMKLIDTKNRTNSQRSPELAFWDTKKEDGQFAISNMACFCEVCTRSWTPVQVYNVKLKVFSARSYFIMPYTYGSVPAIPTYRVGTLWYDIFYPECKLTFKIALASPPRHLQKKKKKNEDLWHLLELSLRKANVVTKYICMYA